jgi:hypothetical protein
MKNNFARFAVSLCMLLACTIPQLAIAQSYIDNWRQDNQGNNTFELDDNTRRLNSDDNTRDLVLDDNTQTRGGVGSLTNPLKAQSIQGFFLAILDILLVFALPIIVLFIMYAGFKYVTARGDANKIADAHQALLWSVIGGVIILGAKLIIDVIQNTVNAI